MRIILVGLNASDKTTIIYMFMLGEVMTTIPTIGFNVESVEYRNLSFTSWDVGGRGSAAGGGRSDSTRTTTIRLCTTESLCALPCSCGSL